MRVLFDTSVLVPAVVQAHSMHAKALPWLMRAQSGGDLQLVLSSHSLAELYASLTRLPVNPRITPDRAWKIIDGVVAAAREIVSSPPRTIRLRSSASPEWDFRAASSTTR